jgi:hypothetical protein
MIDLETPATISSRISLLVLLSVPSAIGLGFRFTAFNATNLSASPPPVTQSRNRRGSNWFDFPDAGAEKTLNRI